MRSMSVDHNKEKETLNTTVDDEQTIREPAIGKGMAGALKFLQERGQFKETADQLSGTGTETDKKKSKLVEDGEKEILIDRRDENGRIMGPKEAYRRLSHAFHGKIPGKNKQEKRRRKYEEELEAKSKSMNDADSSRLLSVERMREAQEKLKSPYLVLSGNFNTGPAKGIADESMKRKVAFQGFSLRKKPKT